MLFPVRLVCALVSVLILLASCLVLTWHQGPAKSWVNIFWGSSSLSGTMLVLAPPGAVPAVGGYLYPSVLRSPGATPQECRAAHGPRHPAVIIPLRLCMLGVCFVCMVFPGYLYVFCVSFMVFGVGMLSGLVPFRTSPLFALVLVSSPFFLLLGCSSAPFASLSLSLSLRCWGNPNPFLVWVSPCVSSTWTRTAPPTRTLCSASLARSSPAPAFFFCFFLSAARVGFFWVWFLLSGRSVGLSVCLSVGLSVCLPVHARLAFVR